jgi:hypothetical protein
MAVWAGIKFMRYALICRLSWRISPRLALIRQAAHEVREIADVIGAAKP